MVEGKITEVGTYEELLEQDQAFAEYLRNYGSKEENNEDQESSEKRDIPFNILLLTVCFTDQYPASLPVIVMYLIAVHTWVLQQLKLILQCHQLNVTRRNERSDCHESVSIYCAMLGHILFSRSFFVITGKRSSKTKASSNDGNVRLEVLCIEAYYCVIILDSTKSV